MKRIEAHWLSYKLLVIPTDAEPVQFKESRRAFYAGAGCLLDELVNIFSLSQQVTESDIEKLEDVSRELREFSASVERGEA